MARARRSEEEVTAWKDKMGSLAGLVRNMSAEEKMKLLAAYNVVTCEGHKLTDHNTLFLVSQTVAAGLVPTVIGGFRQWQASGRVVKAGEHACGYIYVPIGNGKSKESPAKPEENALALIGAGQGEEKSRPQRFRLVPVFDISQTRGEHETPAEVKTAEEPADVVPVVAERMEIVPA